MWGNGEVLFDLHEEGGSAVTGLVSLVANESGTGVEVGVIGTTLPVQASIYAGSCSDLGPAPAYELEPVLTETMSSVTNLAVLFDELTNGGYAIAVRDGEDGSGALLACNEIPNSAEQATS